MQSFTNFNNSPLKDLQSSGKCWTSKLIPPSLPLSLVCCYTHTRTHDSQRKTISPPSDKQLLNDPFIPALSLFSYTTDHPVPHGNASWQPSECLGYLFHRQTERARRNLYLGGETGLASTREWWLHSKNKQQWNNSNRSRPAMKIGMR